VVAEHGRFGNNVRQIAYALAAARRLGVREVVAKSLPLTPIGYWEVEEGLHLTHDPLLRPRIVTKPKVILGGDFFVVRRLPVSVDESDYSTIGRALARATGLEPEVPLEEETLVIHVRSGDAFSAHPHGALGQPPLSFYQMVLAELNPSHVVLVFEDEANPVIARTGSRTIAILNLCSVSVGVSSRLTTTRARFAPAGKFLLLPVDC
jgi:hypothetical protein